MATRKDLVLFQNNTETVDLAVFDEETKSPTDLTGKTLNAYIKTSALVADADVSVIKLSSGGGSPAITISSPPTAGLAVMVVPSTALAAAANLWWHLDVAELHQTVMLGNLTVAPV